MVVMRNSMRHAQFSPESEVRIVWDRGLGGAVEDLKGDEHRLHRVKAG